MTTKFVSAAFVTVGLAVAPLAAEGKSYTYLRHDVSTMQSAAYGTSGLSTPPSGTYGTSGTSVGTRHRTLGGVVQLAFGRRDKRCAHLAQHQSSCSQIARSAAVSKLVAEAAPPSMSPVGIERLSGRDATPCMPCGVIVVS